MESLPDDVEVKIKWSPFFLDPRLPTKSVNKLDMYKRKFGAERIEGMIENMKSVGQESGITFSYGGKVGNTMDSHRLVEYTQNNQNLQDALMENMFSLYFEKEGDIADKATLAKAACEAGVFTSQDDAMHFLNSDQMSAEVKKGVEEAYERGVSGVPFFIIQDQYSLSGAQEPSMFQRVFNKLGIGSAKI